AGELLGKAQDREHRDGPPQSCIERIVAPESEGTAGQEREDPGRAPGDAAAEERRDAERGQQEPRIERFDVRTVVVDLPAEVEALRQALRVAEQVGEEDLGQ